MLSAQPHQKRTMYDDLKGHTTVAPESAAVDTLPTSTRPSVQEDIPDLVSAADNASGPTSSRLCNTHSVGGQSVNADGSFMHIEGLASADDAECHQETETTQEFAVPVDSPEPAAHTALSQDANTVLDRLSEDMSGHAGQASFKHTQEESTEACFLGIVTDCCWYHLNSCHAGPVCMTSSIFTCVCIRVAN